MPGSDPVDSTARIFTERDVYTVVGYVAGWFDLVPPEAEMIAAVERGIQVALTMESPSQGEADGN